MSRMLSLAALLLVGAALAPACLRVDHGIVVELRMAALRTGGASELTPPGGEPFVLDAGEITIRDVTLLPCVESAVHARVEAWGPLVLAIARAHEHEGGGPVIRGPFRVSLTDDETTIGAFTPAPRAYCALHVNLGPLAEGSEPAWTSRARAHAHDGTALEAWSDAVSAAHVVPAEAFDLTTPGARAIHMSLYESRGFSGTNFDVHEARALGDALIGGVVAQSDATLTADDDAP